MATLDLEDYDFSGNGNDGDISPTTAKAPKLNPIIDIPDLSLTQQEPFVVSEANNNPQEEGEFDFSGLLQVKKPGRENAVSSGYGKRKPPKKGASSFHDGLDIPLDANTPLKPFGKGTVTFAGNRKGYGKSVGIDYGNGVTIYLNHLNRIDLEVGDRITPEAIVGLSGNTGVSTAPHVHVQALKDGVSIDPRKVFNENPNEAGLALTIRGLIEDANVIEEAKAENFDFSGLIETTTTTEQSSPENQLDFSEQIPTTENGEIDTDVLKFAPADKSKEVGYFQLFKEGFAPHLKEMAQGIASVEQFRFKPRTKNPNEPGKPISFRISGTDGKMPTVAEINEELARVLGITELNNKFKNDKEFTKGKAGTPLVHLPHPYVTKNADGSWQVIVEQGMTSGGVELVNAYARGGAKAYAEKRRELEGRAKIYQEDLDQQKLKHQRIQNFQKEHPYLSILIDPTKPIKRGLQDIALSEIQLMHSITMLPRAIWTSEVHGTDSEAYANLMREDAAAQIEINKAVASIPREEILPAKLMRAGTSAVGMLPRFGAVGKLGSWALPTLTYVENLHRGNLEATKAALPMAVMVGTQIGLDKFMTMGGNPLDLFKRSEIANDEIITSITQRFPYDPNKFANKLYMVAQTKEIPLRTIDFRTISPLQRQLILRGANALTNPATAAITDPNIDNNTVIEQLLIGLAFPQGKGRRHKASRFQQRSIIGGDAYTLPDGSVLLSAPVDTESGLIGGRVPGFKTPYYPSIFEQRAGEVRPFGTVVDVSGKPVLTTPDITTKVINGKAVTSYTKSKPVLAQERPANRTLGAGTVDIRTPTKSIVLPIDQAALNLINLRRAYETGSYLQGAPPQSTGKIGKLHVVVDQRKQNLLSAIKILDEAVPKETQDYFAKNEALIREAIRTNYEDRIRKEEFVLGKKIIRKPNNQLTLDDVRPYNPVPNTAKKPVSPLDNFVQNARRTMISVEEAGKRGLESNKQNKGSFNMGLDPSDVPYLVQIAIGKLGRKSLDAAEFVREMAVEYGDDFFKYGTEVFNQAKAFIDGVNNLADTLTGPHIKKLPFEVADIATTKNVYYIAEKYMIGAKEEDIPLDKVIGTQTVVKRDRLLKFGEEPNIALLSNKLDSVGNLDIPKAVKIDDKYLLFDGHHRTSAEKIRGSSSIRGRVIDFNEVASGKVQTRIERARETFGDTGKDNKWFTQEKQIEVRENFLKPPDENQLNDATSLAKWFAKETSNLTQIVGFYVEDAYRRKIEPNLNDILSNLRVQLGDWIDKIDYKDWNKVFDNAVKYYQINNADPFFSQFKQNVLEKFPDGNLNAQSARSLIEKLGTKQEIEWTSGLLSWIEDKVKTGKKINKNELIDYIERNQVKVDEIILGNQNKGLEDAVTKASELSTQRYEELQEEINSLSNRINMLKGKDFSKPSSIRILGEYISKDRELNLEDISYYGEDVISMIRNELVPFIEDYNEAVKLEEKAQSDLTKHQAENPSTRYDLKTYGGNEKLELEGGRNPKEVLLQVPKPSDEKFVRKVEAQKEFDAYFAEMRNKYGANFKGTELSEQESAIWYRLLQATFDEIDAENRREHEIKARNIKKSEEIYSHSHWRPYENVVAHFRANERETIDGNKVFHSEEFQSDWNQTGRKEGYKKDIPKDLAFKLEEATQKRVEAAKRKETYPPNGPLFNKLRKDWMRSQKWENHRVILRDEAGNIIGEGENLNKALADYNERYRIENGLMTSAQAKEIREQGKIDYERWNAIEYELFEQSQKYKDAVPENPFMENNWKELVFKRFLRMGIEMGKDGVSWTTARQQQERYGKILETKNIGYEALDNGNYNLSVRGYGTIEENVTPKRLREIVGNEFATLIEQDVEKQGGIEKGFKTVGEVKGIDAIKIATSKHTDYDIYFVNLAKKIGKKFGAEYKIKEIETSGKEPEEYKLFNAEEINEAFENGAAVYNKTKGEVYNTNQTNEAIIALNNGDHIAMEVYEKSKIEKVHYLEITPKMRDSILKEGQPIYGLTNTESLKPSASTGIRNKLITRDAFDRAKSEVANSLLDITNDESGTGTVLNSGLNPDAFLNQVKLLYKGWNDFTAFSDSMIRRYGAKITPHLESIWNWIKESAIKFHEDERGILPIGKKKRLYKGEELDVFNLTTGTAGRGGSAFHRFAIKTHRMIALAQQYDAVGEIYNVIRNIQRTSNAYSTNILEELSRAVDLLHKDTDQKVAQAIFTRNKEAINNPAEDAAIIARFGLDANQTTAYNYIRAAVSNVLDLRRDQLLYREHQNVAHINEQLTTLGLATGGTPVNAKHADLLNQLVEANTKIQEVEDYYQELKDTGYVSLQRIGRYRAELEDPTVPATITVGGKTKKNPDRMLIDYADTPEDAQKRINEWKEQYGLTNNGRILDAKDPEAFREIAMNITPGEFEELIRTSGARNTPEIESLRAEVYERFPTMGYNLKRELYPGYRENHEFLIKSITRQAEVYGSSYYNNIAREEGKRALANSGLDTIDKELYNVVYKYIEDETSSPNYNLATKYSFKMRKLAYMMQLAWDFKQFYLNAFVQPVTQNYNYLARIESPTTSKRLGGINEVERVFIRGTKLALRMAKALREEKKGTLKVRDAEFMEFRDIYRQLQEEKIIAPEYTKSLLELEAEQASNLDNRFQSKTRRFFSMHQQEHWGGTFMRAGERVTRTQMAASMFLAGKKFGLTGNALTDFIVRGIDATNTNPTRGENPHYVRRFGEAGKLFYQFGAFRHMWWENLALNVRSDFKHRSLSATSRTLAPLAIMGGISGLPLTGLAFSLYGLVTGRNPDEDLKKWVKNKLADDDFLERLAMYGITTNASFSQAVGIKAPIVDTLSDQLTQDSWWDKLFSSNVPALMTTKQIGQALTLLGSGVYNSNWKDVMTAVVTGAPLPGNKAARNIVKAQRAYDEGFRTPSGDIIKSRSQTTGMDIGLQIIGLSPNELGEFYNEKKYKKLRTSDFGKASRRGYRKLKRML